jgi:hypothetical protein
VRRTNTVRVPYLGHTGAVLTPCVEDNEHFSKKSFRSGKTPTRSDRTLTRCDPVPVQPPYGVRTSCPVPARFRGQHDKPGLTHDKFVHAQIFRVGPGRIARGAGARKVEDISPDFTVLDSSSDLALPCWTLIRV